MRYASDVRAAFSFVEVFFSEWFLCYAEASASAYETYVVRTRLRVKGSGRTYAEEAKSSTVVEGERHMGVLWRERPRLEKEVKLRNILRKTQAI